MTRRIIARLHLWIGLALCLPLAMLGLTGSILVFEDELRDIFAAPHPAARGEPRAIDEIVAAAQKAAAAGYVPVSYVAPVEPGSPAAVRLAPARGGASASERVRVDVDPVSLRTRPNSETGFFRQAFFLHSTLLLRNREGRQLAGWLGVAMLVMGVSGLVNWWPRRGRWRAGLTVTRGAHGYRLHRDVHGAVGIWSLAVFLAVSFSGVYLSFPQSIRTAVDLVLPARDLRGAATAPRVEPIDGAEPLGIDAAVALARARFPDTAPGFIFLPARPDQPIRIGLRRLDGDRHGLLITVLVDPWARQVVEAFDPRQFSAGETILAWQHALHAGQGFSPVWKVLVFLSGMLPLLFTVTGVLIWQLRRRRRPTAAANSNPVFDQPETARRAGG